MKKFSRIATFLVLFASFAAPSLALAGTQVVGQSCNDGGDCIAGLVCTGNSTCQASVGGTQSYSGGAGSVNTTYLDFYKNLVTTIVNDYLVWILMAIAFIVFLWGVFKYYIYNADNETERTKGHQLILWGVIGFVVISSIWGIVNIVKGVLVPSAANQNRPAYPKL